MADVLHLKDYSNRKALLFQSDATFTTLSRNIAGSQVCLSVGVMRAAGLKVRVVCFLHLLLTIYFLFFKC